MRLILSVFFVLIFQYSHSQSIAGRWSGKMYMPGKTDTTLINIEIKQKKKGFSGTVVSIFPNGELVIVTIIVKPDSISKSVYLKEQFIMEKSVPDYQPFFLDEYYLTFVSEKSMTGIVKCIRIVNNKNYRDLPCHDDAFIDLVRTK
jgi:hypothetical protein